MRRIRYASIWFFLACIMLCAAGFTQAQVTLDKADLVVIGFATDDGGSGDSWVLLALADVPADSKIFITDRGWHTDESGFTTGAFDSTIAWTVPSGGVSAGTILYHDALPGMTSGGPLDLNHLGEQLLIYQTTDGLQNSSPTFIYGFNDQVELSGSGNTDGQWHSGTFPRESGYQSNLPPGLTEVTSAGATGSAFGLAGELDNLYYHGAISGDKTAMLAAIHDPANWTGSDGDPADGIGSNPYHLSAGGVFAGTIMVTKQTEPGGSLIRFEFSSDYSSNFSLSDGQVNDSGPLEPGIYEVNEINLPAGWTLTSVSCDDGSVPDAIELAPGETVMCAFTNTKETEPELTIIKEQSLDGFSWSTDELSVDPTDEIFYKLTVASTVDVYGLVISDILDADVEYQGTWDGVDYTIDAEYTYPPEHSLNYLVDLLANVSKEILFKVSFDDLAPGTLIKNTAWAGDVKSNEVSAEVVPEPATITLLGIGLVGALTLLRRRRRRKKS